MIPTFNQKTIQHDATVQTTKKYVWIFPYHHYQIKDPQKTHFLKECAACGQVARLTAENLHLLKTRESSLNVSKQLSPCKRHSEIVDKQTNHYAKFMFCTSYNTMVGTGGRGPPFLITFESLEKPTAYQLYIKAVTILVLHL